MATITLVDRTGSDCIIGSYHMLCQRVETPPAMNVFKDYAVAAATLKSTPVANLADLLVIEPLPLWEDGGLDKFENHDILPNHPVRQIMQLMKGNHRKIIVYSAMDQMEMHDIGMKQGTHYDVFVDKLGCRIDATILECLGIKEKPKEEY